MSKSLVVNFGNGLRHTIAERVDLQYIRLRSGWCRAAVYNGDKVLLGVGSTKKAAQYNLDTDGCQRGLRNPHTFGYPITMS